MGIADWLADSTQVNRRDLRTALDASDGVTDALAREVDSLAARLARTELLAQSLYLVLKSRGLLTDAELELMVARVDLADGFEDGLIGPDRSTEAYACGACGKPVNTQRAECIYCDTPIASTPATRTKPSYPSVTCSRCQDEVASNTTWFSEHGLLCSPCHQSPPEGGGLSVAEDTSGRLSGAE